MDSLFPFGGGKIFIIDSKISSTPSPVFPEQLIAFAMYLFQPHLQFVF